MSGLRKTTRTCLAGHPAAPGERFCGTCGSPVPELPPAASAPSAASGPGTSATIVACRNGHANELSTRFCGDCGTPVSPTASATQAKPQAAQSTVEWPGLPPLTLSPIAAQRQPQAGPTEAAATPEPGGSSGEDVGESAPDQAASLEDASGGAELTAAEETIRIRPSSPLAQDSPTFISGYEQMRAAKPTTSVWDPPDFDTVPTPEPLITSIPSAEPCQDGHTLEVGSKFCGVCGAPASAPGATDDATTPHVALEAGTCRNGHPLGVGSRFCGVCGAPADGLVGAPVSASCGNGHPLEASSRFCGVCGAPAASAAEVSQCSAGHPAEPGTRFCAICGSPVTGS